MIRVSENDDFNLGPQESLIIRGADDSGKSEMFFDFIKHALSMNQPEDIYPMTII